MIVTLALFTLLRYEWRIPWAGRLACPSARPHQLNGSATQPLLNLLIRLCVLKLVLLSLRLLGGCFRKNESV